MFSKFNLLSRPFYRIQKFSFFGPKLAILWGWVGPFLAYFLFLHNMTNRRIQHPPYYSLHTVSFMQELVLGIYFKCYEVLIPPNPEGVVEAGAWRDRAPAMPAVLGSGRLACQAPAVNLDAQAREKLTCFFRKKGKTHKNIVYFRQI